MSVDFFSVEGPIAFLSIFEMIPLQELWLYHWAHQVLCVMHFGHFHVIHREIVHYFSKILILQLQNVNSPGCSSAFQKAYIHFRPLPFLLGKCSLHPVLPKLWERLLQKSCGYSTNYLRSCKFYGYRRFKGC